MRKDQKFMEVSALYSPVASKAVIPSRTCRYTPYMLFKIKSFSLIHFLAEEYKCDSHSCIIVHFAQRNTTRLLKIVILSAGRREFPGNATEKE